MVDDESKIEQLPDRRDRFATTQWSVVVSAGGSHTSQSRRALAVLCESYWFPLYAFVRRAGHSAEDAQDLTQEFFARLLADNTLTVADRQRGRFRSFLLGAMKHFLSKQRRRQRALKRGGGRAVLSLDFHDGEGRYGMIEPADHLTPERLYEKRWAMTLLDLVLGRLRDEYHAAGKLELFDGLKPFLAGRRNRADPDSDKTPEEPARQALPLTSATPTYQEVGKELDMSEGAVKVAVHRLRRRYRKLLVEEIARTIDGPETLENELRDLMAALSSGK
ncbi:MAG: sigma-70 family RNA polymerase sigma factor [Planctomycetota bacterium]|nr:sigma-70 family RNA polymerase sigma factor [Planctomycetota bacterium]